MLGPIIGDVIGSFFEYTNTKREDFPLFDLLSMFIDDTVMTVAVADALLNRSDVLDNQTAPALYAAKFRACWRTSPLPQ